MPEVNPFELQQPQQPPPWGGLAQLVPQEPLGEVPEGGWLGGLDPSMGGSYNALSPEVMNMLWQPQQNSQSIAPPQQQMLVPKQQPLI